MTERCECHDQLLTSTGRCAVKKAEANRRYYTSDKGKARDKRYMAKYRARMRALGQCVEFKCAEPLEPERGGRCFMHAERHAIACGRRYLRQMEAHMDDLLAQYAALGGIRFDFGERDAT